MKNLIPLFFIVCFLNIATSTAQNYCEPQPNCLFWEPQPEEVITETNVTYATNVPKFDDLPFGFNTVNLKLDLYYPDITPGETRPLVIISHGGGFFGGDKSETTLLAETMASYGYVVANINYRVCEKLCCQVWASPCQICYLNIKRTRYLGTLDALTSAEYLIANANQYHIDTENIFFAGVSAGGVISLSAAYLKQDEANASFDGFPSQWGDLPVIENIKGVANISGAILDTLSIDNEDQTAAFLVHGTCDNVVVYDAGGAYNCNNFATIYGSATCAQRLENEDLSYQLFTGVNMDHNSLALYDIWLDEMLNFFRRTLCEEKMQAHTIVELQPRALGCETIEQPIINLPNIQDTLVALCDSSNPINTPTDVSFGLSSPSLSLEIHPNPSSNFLQIKSDKSLRIDQLQIYNIKGKIQNVFSIQPGQEDIKIDISNLDTSTYFLVAMYKGQYLKTTKFIKH